MLVTFKFTRVTVTFVLIKLQFSNENVDFIHLFGALVAQA